MLVAHAAPALPVGYSIEGLVAISQSPMPVAAQGLVRCPAAPRQVTATLFPRGPTRLASSGCPPVIVCTVAGRLSLIEFPADDPDRARRFWSEFLGASFEVRGEGEGEGWTTREQGSAIGVHRRGPGPGDSASLPYFNVDDLETALERVRALGGSVVHPGAQWAICKDSEGSPFGLAGKDPRL